MCYSRKTIIREFRTKNFRVVASIEPDDDVDFSYDETNETRLKLASGEWEAFQTAVRVYWNGAEIGADYLGGSIYANPKDFFKEHRDADPLNRNCSIMRAARGQNAAIGHYFPDMVRSAIGEARKAMANPPRIRA